MAAFELIHHGAHGDPRIGRFSLVQKGNFGVSCHAPEAKALRIALVGLLLAAPGYQKRPSTEQYEMCSRSLPVGLILKLLRG